MEILHRDDLPLSGCAGLREHRLVMGSKIYSDSREPGSMHRSMDHVSPTLPAAQVSLMERLSATVT